MRENVNIVLADDADFAEACTELEQHGLVVRSEIPELGAVLGTIDSALLPGLRALDGVLAVERETIVSTPPVPEDGPTFSAPEGPGSDDVHVTGDI